MKTILSQEEYNSLIKKIIKDGIQTYYEYNILV